MSDTQNKWVPVIERLPENGLGRLVVFPGKGIFLGYYDKQSNRWFELPEDRAISCVTHWMDLPEPPAPPKPADQFEAWWWLNRNAVKFCMGDARLAWDGGWNAAKEHYSKPLPDFETWWDSRQRGFVIRTTREMARHIWNAAQGKPEA